MPRTRSLDKDAFELGEEHLDFFSLLRGGLTEVPCNALTCKSADDLVLLSVDCAYV